jgi:hypothetical protein
MSLPPLDAKGNVTSDLPFIEDSREIGGSQRPFAEARRLRMRRAAHRPSCGRPVGNWEVAPVVGYWGGVAEKQGRTISAFIRVLKQLVVSAAIDSSSKMHG